MKRERKKKHELQVQNYNTESKDLPSLEKGEIVRVKLNILGDQVWKVVTRRLDQRSYEICAEDGNMYRRTRVQLKATNEESSFEQKDQEKKDEVEDETTT